MAPVTENEMIVCTAIWIGGALLIFWAVSLFISYKTKGVRRRQRKFHRDFEAQAQQHQRRRTDR